MKTIHLKHPHRSLKMPELVLALGFFDGVHKGHEQVILTAKKKADELGIKSGVMTFSPHPKEVLRKGANVQYLTNMEMKTQLIEKLQVDYLLVVEFNIPFSELTPQQFVDQYLIDLNVKHVVAGFDYTFGRLGAGRMETLPFHSRNKLTYSVVDKVEKNGEKISSTNVRQAIREGNIKKANDYLGRPYEMVGEVVQGEQRGRTIGFPTANIAVEKQSITPSTGVYIVQILVNNRWYDAVCNVGFKPTFHDNQEGSPTIEVHIFQFNESIYGKKVRVKWYEKLREEQKFDSVDELISQLHQDKKDGSAFFQKNKEISSISYNNT